MRLLLVGAFAYPHDQGSQVYFQEQAIALRAAGAEVALLTYGPGRRRQRSHPLRVPTARPRPDDPDRWRALDGFDHTALPAWAAPALATARVHSPQSPSPISASPSPCAGRCAVAVPERASSNASESGLRRAHPRVIRIVARRIARVPRPHRPFAPARFDAILAHHAEAALLALHALPRSRPPVVYCAHTLLEHELPEYFEPARRRALAAIGRSRRRIDRRIARRADAWIALTQSAERVIERVELASGPKARAAAPGPRASTRDRPRGRRRRARSMVSSPAASSSTRATSIRTRTSRCSSAWRTSGVAGARRRGDRSTRRSARFPIVIATHDERAPARETSSRHAQRARAHRASVSSGSASPREANALVAAARASLVPRRSVGGFPIKLVNSLAAGTPVVAFHGEEWGLGDGRDSLLGSLDQPVASLGPRPRSARGRRSPSPPASAPVPGRPIWPGTTRPGSPRRPSRWSSRSGRGRSPSLSDHEKTRRRSEARPIVPMPAVPQAPGLLHCRPLGHPRQPGIRAFVVGLSELGSPGRERGRRKRTDGRAGPRAGAIRPSTGASARPATPARSGASPACAGPRAASPRAT